MADLTSASTGAGGLGTPAARWALTATWAFGVASDVLGSALAPPFSSDLLAPPCGLLGALVLTRRGNEPLSTGRAVVVGAAAVISAFGALASDAPLGHTWSFNFAAYLAALLLPRGNVRTGLVSGALIGMLGLGWAIHSEASTSQLIDLLALPLLALVVGGTWRWLLARIVARELTYNRDTERAAMATRIADASAAATQAELTEIGNEVGGLLRAIRDGRQLDDDLLAEISITEADLRDRIRSPNLRDACLRTAIDRARRRGVNVLLLGNSPHQRPVTDALAKSIAESIDAIPSGTVTVRTIRPGRDGVISLVRADDQAKEHLVFAADGHLLTRH